MRPTVRQIMILTLIVLGVVIVLATLSTGVEPEEISYNQFVNKVERGEVAKVSSYGNVIEAVLFDGTEIEITRPEDHYLTEMLLENEVPYSSHPERGPEWWQTALPYMIPFLLIVGIFFFFMQQSQGGGNRMMNFGRSKVKLQESDKKKFTIDDVGTQGVALPQNYIGKICPYCQFAISQHSEVIVCSECNMPHHRECWNENGGCTTFGHQGHESGELMGSKSRSQQKH